MTTARKITIWLGVLMWLLVALVSLHRAWSILLYYRRAMPIWLAATLLLHFLSGTVFGVAIWSLFKERSPVRAWELLGALAFLLFAMSKMVMFWRIGLFDCLALAFALGQVASWVRTGSDSLAGEPASDDIESAG